MEFVTNDTVRSIFKGQANLVNDLQQLARESQKNLNKALHDMDRWCQISQGPKHLRLWDDFEDKIKITCISNIELDEALDKIFASTPKRKELFKLVPIIWHKMHESIIDRLETLEDVNKLNSKIFYDIPSTVRQLEQIYSFAEDSKNEIETQCRLINLNKEFETIEDKYRRFGEEWKKDIRKNMYNDDLGLWFDFSSFNHLKQVFDDHVDMVTRSLHPIIVILKKLIKTKAVSPKRKNIIIVPMPEGTKPEDITFKFRDGQTMNIFYKDKPYRANISPEDWGFYPGKKGRMRNVLWDLLLVMSNAYSDSTWAWTDKSDKYRAQISNLNRRLQEVLEIKDKPILLNEELNGYRSRIHLIPPPPDDTHRSYCKPSEM